jgi:DNA-binding CsgD family transcriptional regulator
MIGNAAIRKSERIFVDEGWAARNVQAQRMFQFGEPRFIRDQDVFTDDEMATDEYYTKFLAPQGLRWGAGTFISSPSEDTMIVTVHRGAECGRISDREAEQLDQLRPFIARATFAATRLKLQQCQVALDILERIGLPAAALDAAGRLRHANSIFQELVPKVAEDRRERFYLKSQGADKRLAATLSNRASFGATFGIQSDEGSPFIVHMIPVAGAARDLFAVCRWIIILVPIAKSEQIDTEVLRGLFDYTPTEAKIASQIVAGNSLNEIASGSGRSIDTIRQQVKIIFSKSGVSRQAELVSLFANARKS